MLKVLGCLGGHLGGCCGGSGDEVLELLDLDVLVLEECFLFVIEDCVLQRCAGWFI